MSNSESVDDLLSERAQRLLKVLIESYIRDGQPVGSRMLSRESGLNLSSATVRNVMADLEALGFVTSPHTSAGRVPTDKGYRLFVNSLLKVKPLEELEVAELQRRFTERPDQNEPKILLTTVSQVLSTITHLAGVVTIPRQSHAAVTQIDFVGISENRVLAVLEVNGREVQNRILQLERHYSQDELRRASNYLNEHFRGRTLTQLRSELVMELQEARQHLNQAMLDAIQLAQQVVAPIAGAEEPSYVLAGETNLMGFAELSNVEKLRRLFEAFTEKRDILHLLDQSLQGQGVQIFIGQESGYQILDDCSVVTAPYTLDDEVVGVLGVIGPTRMAYERVIPIVDITARLLGAALNSRPKR